MDNYDNEKWSTVILRPTVWQRLRFLFSRSPEIIFCWGEDRYTMKGVTGWQYFACGGMPVHMRERSER